MSATPKNPIPPHALRLRAARKAAGYDNATDAAEAMGVKVPTYIHHENGTSGLSRSGERYARFFKVSLDWLLTGKGDMRGRRPSVPIMGTVAAGSSVTPISTDEAVAAFGDLVLPGGPHTAALLVRGDSMWPRFQDGEWVLFDSRPERPENLVNRYCVIDLEDGRRVLKILKRGIAGSWALESHNAPAETKVTILGAYRYLGLLPP